MRVLPAVTGILRPYALHGFLLAYTPALLFVDGRTADHGVQLGLGALTLAVLVACVRSLGPDARRQAWICVPVATVFEIFGSLIWGGYHYRLGKFSSSTVASHCRSNRRKS